MTDTEPKPEMLVTGHVIQDGTKINPRGGAVDGGEPSMTVNYVCGSRAQDITSTAQEIWLSDFLFLPTLISGGIKYGNADG